MNEGSIRPIAICVFRDGDRILVAEGYDPTKRQTFYRPLGGAIEFGEHSRSCIVREIREELGAEIEEVTHLGTLETVFVFDGAPGHEIVAIYDARFVDRSMYGREIIEGREGDGTDFVAMWKPLSWFRTGPPLYPEGLLDLLEGRTA
jgi:8-oxo-dGTP pyrophosphatase MutT (NUDIX family)